MGLHDYTTQEILNLCFDPANSMLRLQSGLLAKTGQLTQYSGELDDGYYQVGIPKRFQSLTTGQYAGTTPIWLAHYAGTAGNVAFVAATKKITDVDNGLAIFKTGDIIKCVGPAEAANIATLTVATGNVAAEIVTTEALTNETPAGVVTIYKRELHSNNCVLDLNSGRTWSRTAMDKMGAASDGQSPWTGALYDVFAYCAACNTAALAGHTNWRIPNRKEWASIITSEAPSSKPDVTYFDNMPYIFWTSTTQPEDVTKAFYASGATGRIIEAVKTASYGVLLVRGGV